MSIEGIHVRVMLQVNHIIQKFHEMSGLFKAFLEKLGLF